MATDTTATDFLKKATTAAEHFGFRSADSYKKNQVCANCGSSFKHSSSAHDRKRDALYGLLSAGVNTYADRKLHALEGPVLCYNVEQVPRTGEVALTLHVFNVNKSIAEALLIQTSRAIARDLGYSDQTVRINSLGDADSVTRYNRELTNYFRKRANDLPQSTRELMKEHVHDALQDLIAKDHELSYRSPNSLEYLSDTSRKHFREIVEYLDMSETPYEIDNRLIGHPYCYSDALFAIDIHDEEQDNVPLSIRGGRYDAFMRHHAQDEVPAAGAVIMLRGKKAPRRTPRVKQTGVPAVYVVQLGFGPKIRSLLLLDELRNANIPAYQNLASDSLSTQLRDAETQKVKYTILIGQKEYVEGCVILRDMIGRNQENVPTSEVTSRLRRLKMHV